jgi:cytochrome c oxidase subunit IV
MSSESMASAPMIETDEPALHDEPNYIMVFIYLAVLTGVELVIYAAGLPKVVTIGSLVALALAKAVLVAMYFMHLAIERKGLWIIASIPLVIIAFCYWMIRPDLSYRLWASNPVTQVIGHREGEAETGAESHSDAPPSGSGFTSPQSAP